MLEYEQRRRRRRIVPWVVLVLLAAVFAYCTWMFPQLNPGVRRHIPQISSGSNLTQIGLAVIRFSGRHGGRFPVSLRELLWTGELGPGVLICPGSNDTACTAPTIASAAAEIDAGKHVSYLYFGAGLTNETIDPDDVIAFERPGIFGNGVNVLYGDGHVEWQPPRMEAILRKQALSATRPITLPTSPTRLN